MGTVTLYATDIFTNNSEESSNQFNSTQHIEGYLYTNGENEVEYHHFSRNERLWEILRYFLNFIIQHTYLSDIFFIILII